MKKISKQAWQKIIPAAVIIAALIFGGVYYALTWDSVTTFRYQDVRNYNYSGIYPPNEGGGYIELLEGVDIFIRNAGYDRNGNLRELDDENYGRYGVIAVVKVIESENVLYEVYPTDETEDNTKQPGGSAYRLLKPWKTYDSLNINLSPSNGLDFVYYHYGVRGYVRTKVVVQEVLHQTEATHLRTGETITMFENYWVLDGRVSKLRNQVAHGNDRYAVIGVNWRPMEAGETYVVFGWKIFADAKDYPPGVTEMDLYPHQNGVYCLSDPEKMTGYWPESYRRTLWHQSVDYLKETYDLEKYGLK